MKKSILKAIEDFSLLEGEVKEITVALSGGADSMSLLYALLELRQELGVCISAAHLNHMIRGDEADRDEAFVKEQCRALGVTLYCERADVPEYAKQQALSIELAARQVRYEFLSRVSKGLVATAHNSDNNLETVIFNLTRGTAIDGICGIPPKRGKFIRPLLLCTREQIEAYCLEKNIPYVTDSTNLSDDYTRNKIRHKIVPVLRELNPSVESTVMRACSNLRQVSDFLEGLATEVLQNSVLPDGCLDLKDFKALPKAVATQVLKKYVEQKNPEITLEAVHINALYSTALSGGRTSLPKNYSAVCEKQKLFICIASKKAPLYAYEVDLEEKDVNFFENSIKINNLLLNNAFDCDKIIGKLVIRARASGDKIRLLNRGCTKTLNKLYNEYGVPLSERDNLPVIADDNGVVWVCGIGVAQRCAVSKGTKKIKIIEVIKREL